MASALDDSDLDIPGESHAEVSVPHAGAIRGGVRRFLRLDLAPSGRPAKPPSDVHKKRPLSSKRDPSLFAEANRGRRWIFVASILGDSDLDIPGKSHAGVLLPHAGAIRGGVRRF